MSSTGKFVKSHNLPVTRVMHIGFANVREDQTVFLHLVSDVTKRNKSTFFHSKCGRNMDYAQSARQEAMNSAIQNQQGEDTGIVFCPRCGTPADFLKAFEAEREFDYQRRQEDRRREEEERQNREREWNKMIEVLQGEISALIPSSIKMNADQFESRQYYRVKKNGKTYRVYMGIEEEKAENG